MKPERVRYEMPFYVARLCHMLHMEILGKDEDFEDLSDREKVAWEAAAVVGATLHREQDYRIFGQEREELRWIRCSRY